MPEGSYSGVPGPTSRSGITFARPGARRVELSVTERRADSADQRPVEARERVVAQRGSRGCGGTTQMPVDTTPAPRSVCGPEADSTKARRRCRSSRARRREHRRDPGASRNGLVGTGGDVISRATPPRPHVHVHEDDVGLEARGLADEGRPRAGQARGRLWAHGYGATADHRHLDQAARVHDSEIWPRRARRRRCARAERGDRLGRRLRSVVHVAWLLATFKTVNPA